MNFDPYSVGSPVMADLPVLGTRECIVIERPDSLVTGTFLLKVRDLDDYPLLKVNPNNVRRINS